MTFFIFSSVVFFASHFLGPFSLAGCTSQPAVSTKPEVPIGTLKFLGELARGHSPQHPGNPRGLSRLARGAGSRAEEHRRGQLLLQAARVTARTPAAPTSAVDRLVAEHPRLAERRPGKGVAVRGPGRRQVPEELPRIPGRDGTPCQGRRAGPSTWDRCGAASCTPSTSWSMTTSFTWAARTGDWRAADADPASWARSSIIRAWRRT